MVGADKEYKYSKIWGNIDRGIKKVLRELGVVDQKRIKQIFENIWFAFYSKQTSKGHFNRNYFSKN